MIYQPLRHMMQVLQRLKEPGDPVVHNEVIGQVIDPCEGYVKSEILSPTDGIVFFCTYSPLLLWVMKLYTRL